MQKTQGTQPWLYRKEAHPVTPSVFPPDLHTSLAQLQPHQYCTCVTQQQHKSSLSAWLLTNSLVPKGVCSPALPIQELIALRFLPAHSTAPSSGKRSPLSPGAWAGGVTCPSVGCSPGQEEKMWRRYLRCHIFLKFKRVIKKDSTRSENTSSSDPSLPTDTRPAQPAILPLWAIQEVEATARHAPWNSGKISSHLLEGFKPYLLAVCNATKVYRDQDGKVEGWEWVRRSSSKLDIAEQCWCWAEGCKVIASLQSVSIPFSDGLMIAVRTINVSAVLSCSALSSLE